MNSRQWTVKSRDSSSGAHDVAGEDVEEALDELFGGQEAAFVQLLLREVVFVVHRLHQRVQHVDRVERDGVLAFANKVGSVYSTLL